ncbi:cytochrome P450 2D20-like isoform X2 [Poecile atricapillus]|uniref:cytochrome P450 2D20-like isoform X2 n=1 Tax=Poecile atricapillus TaxID=48891 RepID=UPI002739EE9F|nr:cytochrome P450 2D20-like isoform X2 [Poecile atricapillus]
MLNGLEGGIPLSLAALVDPTGSPLHLCKPCTGIGRCCDPFQNCCLNKLHKVRLFHLSTHLYLDVQRIVVARYGHVWKELRRFTLSTLRNFGMGKKSLEERVVEEAGFLCSAIKSEEGKSFDIHVLINNAVCNMICTIVFGDRFDYGDETFNKLSRLFQNSLNEETGFLPQFLNVVPILLRIPGVPQKAFRAQKELMDFIDVVIDKHMKTWDPAYTRDLTDVFLKEMEKGKAAEENGFHYSNLRLVAVDLFTAGSETTSTTLRWALLYMLLHPEIQNKVQAEIDKVIGRERPPTMKDQASMPYTNAVIHEVQRCGDIAPVGLPHMTYRDTELQGFFIPKVAVPVRENSWPGWSSFSSLPLSCRNSLSCSLRSSPGHGRTLTLHSRTLHTHTCCELSQDKCTPFSFHSQTTTHPNSARNIAGLGRIMPGSISSLCRGPHLCKVRI